MTLLTSREVADRLREHPRTVLRRLRSSELRGHKIGRQWLISEDDLQRFLDEHTNYRPVDPRRRRRA